MYKFCGKSLQRGRFVLRHDGKPTPLMIVIASIFAIGVVVLVVQFKDPILLLLFFLLVVFL